MKKPLEIEKVEIFVTGDPTQDRPRWARYLEDVYPIKTLDLTKAEFLGRKQVR